MDYLSSLIVRLFVLISGFCRFEKWEKGKKLKILLVGYNGARNTGADVRVAVMARQFLKIFGKDEIQISILTQSIENFKVYFQPEIRLIQYNTVFFMDLLKACNEHHMVVLCEGSTLKSKFSNALTLFFCQAAGIMKRQKKPCIAYGSEAGEMDGFIRKVVRKTCDETYFIARTEDSLKIIEELGLKGHMGTDTAWTFDSASRREWAIRELKENGWDGSKPLVGVAIINPFWWPVRPSIFKLLKMIATGNGSFHYGKWYFFSWSKERQRLFDAYVNSLAGALNRYAEMVDYYPVIIGMEALDIKACKTLLMKLKMPAALFSSVDYDGYQLKEVLGRLSVLITSRYHARVLSLDAGVPAVAVSMDERLLNIFREIGHIDRYYYGVEDPQLEEKLVRSLQQIADDRERIRQELKSAEESYIRKLDEMGRFFLEFVSNRFQIEHKMSEGLCEWERRYS